MGGTQTVGDSRLSGRGGGTGSPGVAGVWMGNGYNPVGPPYATVLAPGGGVPLDSV